MYAMPSRWRSSSYPFCYYNNYNNTWNSSVCMNINTSYNAGWRDSILRKDLNDNSSDGIIWNAITSNDFKQNVAPVFKITYNNSYIYNTNRNNTSNASSITIDKLWILSPSEMSMPIIKKYLIYGADANVHYYDSDTYKNTTKYKYNYNSVWNTKYGYVYAGDAYQWWMLPAKMSNGNQVYHNTDPYSYNTLANSSNPSTNHYECAWNSYFLRSYYDDSSISSFSHCYLSVSGWYDGAVLAFSF